MWACKLLGLSGTTRKQAGDLCTSVMVYLQLNNSLADNGELTAFNYQNRLPSEAVRSPSLEDFKTWLDKALSNLVSHQSWPCLSRRLGERPLEVLPAWMILWSQAFGLGSSSVFLLKSTSFPACLAENVNQTPLMLSSTCWPSEGKKMWVSWWNTVVWTWIWWDVSNRENSGEGVVWLGLILESAVLKLGWREAWLEKSLSTGLWDQADGKKMGSSQKGLTEKKKPFVIFWKHEFFYWGE